MELQETEKGVKAPNWYLMDTGSFTIKSRYATSVVRNKAEGSDFPLSVWDAHRYRETAEPQNPDIHLDEIVITKHGTDTEQKYEVTG